VNGYIYDEFRRQMPGRQRNHGIMQEITDTYLINVRQMQVHIFDRVFWSRLPATHALVELCDHLQCRVIDNHPSMQIIRLLHVCDVGLETTLQAIDHSG